MLNEYKDKNAKEYQEALEATLAVGAASNRVIVTNTMTGDANAAWQNICGDLNTLAVTFGYPVISDGADTRASNR